MSELTKYTLILSCNDIVGIVAAVSGFMASHNCFILESAQMGDSSTGRFFMRTVFKAQDGDKSHEYLKEKFNVIAEKFSMEWELHDNNIKQRVVIMVSKYGHCLNSLLRRHMTKSIDMEVPAIISNHTDMEDMVKWFGIPFYHLPVTNDNRDEQEDKILEIIHDTKADLTVLARYMQILTPKIIDKVYGKAINIHHSFLPGFKGAKPYHQAYDRGVKIIGATAHYASNDLDEGPIIEQEVMRVNHSHTPDKLLSIGRDIESIVLSRAVRYHLEHRVILNGCKTVVFG